jgi:hypothetical protein
MPKANTPVEIFRRRKVVTGNWKKESDDRYYR